LGKGRSGLGAGPVSINAVPVVTEETTEVLQRLLRFNTVNPPGNERPAQEYLCAYLEQAGLSCELLGRTPERPNLVATLDSGNPGPTLCLLSHVDTVLATAEDWDHDPWSGDVADGFIWGRGALDMKSQTAAEAVAAATLARSGWRPGKGKLLVVCVVDEETGGSEGAQWLTATHPEKVRCDMLINEGGGGVFEHAGRRLITVCCAEKGVFRFRVITDGVAGHASMPRLGDNALLKMVPVLERMRDRQPSFDLTEEPRAFLEAVGETVDDDLQVTLERVRSVDPLMAILLEPMLGVSLSPTRISASEKINVIPAHAELQVDCRVPPGLGEAEALARIQEVLGTEGHRLEFMEKVIGNRSPVESELMSHIHAWCAENDSEATCVPTVLPGFTDSRTFRDAFPECVAYGFFPHRHMTFYDTAPLIHSANERIDVRDLDYAAHFFSDLLERVLG
jgi:acetylornithine deacetylase/succinyl-diaminopimelate desuccinylase-like protein